MLEIKKLPCIHFYAGDYGKVEDFLCGPSKFPQVGAAAAVAAARIPSRQSLAAARRERSTATADRAGNHRL